MSELENKAPGELLKTAREKLGLTINDVSLATKINPRILKALENGTKEDLPPKSFTRGFIRSYSSYLKINADPIIEAFNLAEHVHTPEPGDMEKEKLEEKAAAPVTFSSRSKTLTISGVVVLILIVIGVKQVFDKYSREADVDETPIISTEPIATPEPIKENEKPASEPSPTAVANTPEPTDAAKTAETAAPTEATKAPIIAEPTPTPPAPVTAEKKPEPVAPKIEAPPVAAPKAEVTAAPKVTTPPPTAPAVAAPVVPKLAPPPTEAAKATTTTAVTPPPAAPAVKKLEVTSTPQEVMVEALDKVDLIIKTTEGTKRVQLQPEGIHTIKFTGQMSLEISDGGTVNLIHNGRDKGIPGDLGKAKTVQFP